MDYTSLTVLSLSCLSDFCFFLQIPNKGEPYHFWTLYRIWNSCVLYCFL